MHRVLRKALGDAHRKGTLARNPAELADAPRETAERDGSEMHIWTAAELAKVVSERLGHASATFTLNTYQ